MAEYVALSGGRREEAESVDIKEKRHRVASLDAFRGLSIALMIFVDYAGSVFPFVAHSPWHGIRLADFVTPFFLFIAGISLSLVYKKTTNKLQATHQATLRALKLFLLGILLQGGYFHGVNSLSFGIDVEKIRWAGILQRIAVGYIVAAVCEIWFSNTPRNAGHGGVSFRNYFLHWIFLVSLSGIYLGLLYGLYVPDWQFEVQQTTMSNVYLNNTYIIKKVKCGVRGDLGPACNSAGMIDRYVLGIEHLYKKSAYRNLKVCQVIEGGDFSDDSPSWCQAPFDPEGILGSLMAAVTCILGLHYGHILVKLEDHKDRLKHWLRFSVSVFSFGLFLNLIGDPLNKQLYTISYALLTTGSAGLILCALYFLERVRIRPSQTEVRAGSSFVLLGFWVGCCTDCQVDVGGCRRLSCVFEWIGRHSLCIFILVPSNIAIIVLQGFYWRNPKNNIVHWVLSSVVHD